MTIKQEFKIGDSVYMAQHTGYGAVYITCPDCAGKLYHTITLGCGDTHTIDCANCAAGYEPPSGRVSYYDSIGKAVSCEVIGLELTPKGFDYKLKTIEGYGTGSLDVFATKEEAQIKADEMAAAYVEEQKARIFKKEKDTRSWAWNASYHRSCIKRAKKDLEYHEAKLDVAKVRAKEKEIK